MSKHLVRWAIGTFLVVILLVGALLVIAGLAVMVFLGAIGLALAWIYDRALTWSGIDAWGQRLLIRTGIV